MSTPTPAARWYRTQVINTPDGAVYPPAPIYTEEPEAEAPAQDVIHLLKSLRTLYQPPVWNVNIIVPTLASPYVVPQAWVFPLEGVWYLSRVTLYPFKGRANGAAPVAATYPSQILLNISAQTSAPILLDSTHWDIKDLRISFYNGMVITAENCDNTNAGNLYLEFEEVEMPSGKRGGFA